MNPTNTIKNVIVHHTDTDGHCGGAILKMVMPEAECISINYGQVPEELEFFEEDTHVFFVDFSPTIRMVQSLIDKKVGVSILDHHKHTEELMEHFNGSDLVSFTYDCTKSGSLIAWEFFNPELPAPTPLEYINMYDLGDHSNQNTLPFHYGISMVETDPSDDEAMAFWKALLFEKKAEGAVQEWGVTDQILNLGYTAQMYKNNRSETLMRNAFLFKCRDGNSIYFLNGDLEDHRCFDSLDLSVCNAVGWYFQKPDGTWKWSLRNHTAIPEPMNVRIFAEQFGGGGHNGAAGFTTDTLEEVFKTNI